MWKGRGLHGGGRAGRLWRAWLRLGAVAAVVLTVVLGSFAALAPARAADDDSLKDPCWDAGLDSQSWFACPALNNLRYTAGPLEGMVDGMLMVNSSNYDQDSGTYKVWEIARNIANSLMIIVLLVVIFSQLTGVGIDNYGIKKMLPRLITMAILINLSFFICEVAVDLSNILGRGLRDLFIGAANAVYGSDVEGTLSEILGDLVGGILAAIAGVGAVGTTGLEIAAVASGGGTMVVVVLLLALVVVIAALLLFFAMLGARLIIIVLCMAVAPVAFALYILPNTQNLFKKWWDIFKTALIIYPICGAMGGISMLIKAMLFQNGTIEVWAAVVVMFLPFLPFFLLPTLLKNAISSLGKVGGALMTMGEKATSGARKAQGAARQSETFQNRMAYAKDKTATARAERRVSRYRNRFGVNEDGEINTAGMGDYQRKRLAEAHRTILANDKDEKQTKYDASVAQFEAQRVKQEQEVDRAAAGVARYGSEDYAAAMAAADEERETSAAVAAKLSLMRSSADDPRAGILMADGTRTAYTLENMRDRMQELEQKSRTETLSDDEELDMAALASGMTSMKGGAGMLGKIIRNSGTEMRDAQGNVMMDAQGNVMRTANTNFMSTMGAIYARDGAVKNEMNKKDAGASIYAEQFMPGGDGATGALTSTFGDYQNYTDSNGNNLYAQAMSNRIKSHAAGLGQGGAGFDEHLENLSSGESLGVDVAKDASGNFVAGNTAESKAAYNQVASEYQKIINDESLMNSLDAADRVKVEQEAAKFGINGKSAQTVQFGEGSAEAQAMSDLVDNTGATVVNTAATAAGVAATAVNTAQIADTANNINDGVLQIHGNTANISAHAQNIGMVDMGHYEHPITGNVIHVRQKGNGEYIDDSGNPVGNFDIYRKKQH